jgi:hypothetical protein
VLLLCLPEESRKHIPSPTTPTRTTLPKTTALLVSVLMIAVDCARHHACAHHMVSATAYIAPRYHMRNRVLLTRFTDNARRCLCALIHIQFAIGSSFGCASIDAAYCVMRRATVRVSVQVGQCSTCALSPAVSTPLNMEAISSDSRLHWIRFILSPSTVARDCPPSSVHETAAIEY